jgi:hypothetical protein
MSFSPAHWLRRFVHSRRNAMSVSALVAVLAGTVGLTSAHAAAGTVPAAARDAAPKTAPANAASGAEQAVQSPALAVQAAAAPAPAPAPPAPPVDPYVAATSAQLEPTGLYGAQEHFTPTSEEWSNAKVIVQVARQRGLSPYAAVIAVATAMQESSLRNLTTAVDADSLGLFQQRPSMGWGTAAQLTDPAYAAGAFLSALTRNAPDYDHLQLWQAAQDAQRSGYPTQYARWEDQAARMVHQVATAN